MAALPPAQQRVLIVPALRHFTPPAECCQALAGFSRSVPTLPEAERALTLRGVYTDTSAPDSQQGPSD